ncbi:MAG: excinuclease ABC subunit UvrC [Bacteroidales bacterium]|jgi:excinuclease ABC subunit C|nr:excinuclease ABC subunit UvrC [Bacteroidales bacterium]
MIETLPKIAEIINDLPEKSGVYRYYDAQGVIIYVGKAKNLKKRVASYFVNREKIDPRIRILVRKIADIQYTVVDSEYDALLLENNLIKQIRPKYNILLKDDKSYPWICLSDEIFPRLFSIHRKDEQNATYFGPYASGKIMHNLLDTILEIYQLRTCRQSLSLQFIEKQKYKSCLHYQIGKCSGACIGKITQKEYADNIKDAIRIIEGKTQEVINELKIKMMRYADSMHYELAHLVKLKLNLLEKYQAKSTIVSQSINNVDVFGLATDNSAVYVCYFKVINGSIIQTHTLSVRQQLDETVEDILLYVIVDIRNTYNSTAEEIIAPYDVDFELKNVKITIPKGGDKHKLLQLAYRNAMAYMHEMQNQRIHSNPELHKRKLLETMQKDLRLPAPPAYIECFDNSNIQGKFPVSSMVCFRNGKPSRKEYRIFNVKTLSDTPDDFATMEEAITRRYTRLLEEAKPLPDLLIVDGGKGQVSAAYNTLKKIGIDDKLPLIGIAKRLEEIYTPDDPLPLYVDKKSETQRVIQHLRDEAHRFGITAHRKRRDKALMQTELTNIQGIGEQLAAKLLSVFRSVSIIQNASLEDLEKIIGKAKAQNVYNYYHADLSGK